MPGGRPRLPGTEEERAQRQRARIRRNVQNHRQRRWEAKLREAGQVGRIVDACSKGKKHSHNFDRPFGRKAPSVAAHISNTVTSNLYLEWLSSHLPFRLPFGPSYYDAFLYDTSPLTSTSSLATNQNAFPIDIVCGSWLRHEYTDAPAEETERRVLGELFLSAALRNVKILTKRPIFNTAVIEAHTRTIEKVGRSMRSRPTGIDESEPCLLAGSIMAFALAELVVSSSWERFAFHVRGAGAIFEAAGPAVLKSKFSRMYFHGFRAMALPFALMDRRSNFACNSEWFDLCPPATEGGYRAEHDFNVHSCAFMDIMYQILPIMEAYDAADPSDCFAATLQLRRVSAIRKSLQIWENSFCSEDPWAGISLHVDEETSAAGFPTDCTANLLISLCGASIVVDELCTDLTLRIQHDHGQPSELASAYIKGMEKWIEKTCWSLQILSEVLPRTVGKLNCLFSLHASLSACNKLTVWGIDVHDKREWCQHLGSHFQTHGFPLLSKPFIP